MKHFLLTVICAGVVMFANVVRAEPRVEIVELPSQEDTADVPRLRWVGIGDVRWAGRQPLMVLGEQGKDGSAIVTGALNEEALLLQVQVTDDKHLNNGRDAELRRGDSVSVTIDAFGDSDLGGGKPTLGLDDASLVFGLARSTDSTAYVYAHGRSAGEGPRTDMSPQILREDAQGSTMYRIRIPWSELRVSPAIRDTMQLKVALVDADPEVESPKVHEQTLRLRWQPPFIRWAGTAVTDPGVSSANDYAEVLLCVFSPTAAIEAKFGDATQSITLTDPGTGPLFRRYSVRAYPGSLPTGSIPLNVRVTEGGQTLASATVDVRDRSDTNWFEFRPQNDVAPGSVIGMEDWLTEPAGAKGWVTLDGSRFLLGDGTPIKFWGTNICNDRCAPAKDVADRWSAMLRKYGVNAVRHHKFIQSIGDQSDSTKMDEKHWDGFDYFHHKLTQAGIYTSWSHIYGLKVRPGDRDKLLAYDEVINSHGGFLKGTTYGLVNFAPDVQDLHIQLTVNMLNHTNPYTGERYADDPALVFVEFHNEDDIFFPTVQNAIESSPTYKKLICQMFSDWLRKKYGSHEQLMAAWGERAINAYPEYMKDEHLDQNNIYPIAHFWWYGNEGLANQEANKGVGKRLLDSARFLHETQNAFYKRMEQAIRATGYKGALVGSCWQAGDGISHYYNLYSDWLVGIIDRHNYSGGGSGGHQMKPGAFNNHAMVNAPGSALLSTGMQQAAGRPFQISEWMALIPNEWTAEASPIIAAYGMGLQGWGGSYSFADDYPHYSDTIQTHGVYNVTSPTQLGLYPALARMVYRGDVKQGDVVATRKVHVDSLLEGKLGFRDETVQVGDVKSFAGDIPLQALAAGRVEVEFTDKFEHTSPPDLASHVSGGVVRSSTGQLMWDVSKPQQGYFTIDTAGTKGVVGFAPKRELKLGEVTITPDNEFGVILLTAREQDRSVSNSESMLLTAIARARNTGMKYNNAHTELVEVGQSPIRLEPVRAVVKLDRTGGFTVHALDHDGRRTDKSVEVIDGAFTIDTGRDRTMYYEIAFN